tara:strand:+ start:1254 stop:3749 length:2496 start_codon:yes stop_codon:yes gene_type:complete
MYIKNIQDRQLKNFSIFCILLLVLISCGGGGSSPEPSPTANTGGSLQTTESNSTQPSLPASGAIDTTGSFELDKQIYEDSSEYINQYGLSMINASSAYARGATGRGTVIGIMDSGVDKTHQELNGAFKITSDSILDYQSRSPTTDEKLHGSHVSGIALGERDGTGMHGVAFDAQLFFISIELGTPGETYEPVTIDPTVDYSGIDSSWSNLESYFIERGVTVVNGSFGYQGNINDYTEENLRSAFPNTIEVLAQSTTLDADKTLFVWAAGNGGGYADQGVDYSSPEVFGGLPSLIEELQGHSLAVVSVGPDGQISSFSNRCGVAKDYCLAAPGGQIVSVYAQDPPITNSYGTASGTSMAAPHVSGGLAILASYFEGQLGNTEILMRLLNTADKSGIYADSSIYGQGLMDLDAATRPVGTTMIAALGNSLDSLTLSEHGTFIHTLGPAFGDGIINSLSEKSFVVFDELGAPFKRKLKGTFRNKMLSASWIESPLSFKSNPISQRKIIGSNGDEFNIGYLDLQPNESYLLLNKGKEFNALKYFSYVSGIGQDSYFFLGSGTSPSIFFSGSETKPTNINISTSSYSASPYLDFSSLGSFVGFGDKITNSRSIIFSMFSGEHKESEVYFNKNKNKSNGVLFEIRKEKQNYQLGYQFGYLNEDKSILGGMLEGGYGGLDKSLTSFVGFNFFRGFKNSFFEGKVFYGNTKTDIGRQGLVTDIGNIKSSSFSISYNKSSLIQEYDNIGISISQPLRVEEGGMSLSIPTSRNKYREISFLDHSLGIEPSGREISVEIFYQYRSNYLDFFVSSGFIKDLYHIEENGTLPQITMGFNFYTSR